MELTNKKANPQDVIEEIKRFSSRIGEEIVFCGYGEPTLELESLKIVAEFVKNTYKNVKIRVNTNGHANLIHKRNVLPELKGLVDTFSISLNSDNAKQYKEITRCCYEENEAFNAVKNFIKLSVENGFKTYVSVVDGYKDTIINLSECEKIVSSLGATFRVREFLNEGYSKVQ